MDTLRAKEGERRVTVDPWDIDGWNMLATEAHRASFALAQPVYERLISQFPPTAKFWQAYCEHMACDVDSNPKDVINLYDRAVSNAPTSIELWQNYTTYLIGLLHRQQQQQQQQPDDSNKSNDNSIVINETQIIEVFERALSITGLDIKADPIWLHYLNFIGSHASLSDAQRRDDLRRIHQRAVRNPMDQLDMFWRKYVEFENDLVANKHTTKDAVRAILSEFQSKNHEARTEFRARTNRRQGITTHNLPVPPRSRSKEISQAQSWRRYIGWEKSNHANVSAVDVHARVILAYETSLVPLYRYAEFWIEYIGYLHEYVNALNEREVNNGTLKNGVVGGGGVSTGDKDITGKGTSSASNSSTSTNAKTRSAGTDGVTASTTTSKNGGSGADGDGSSNSGGSNAGASVIAGGSSLFKTEITNLESVLERALRALPDCVAMHVYANNVYVRLGKGDKGISALETLVQKHASPLAYIHLMRATWKHEGRDAARKTFARGRKDKRAADPLMYVAAAMMEFSVSKDSKVPRNVFEFGLKNFPRHAALTLEFVNWLWGTGDTEYARVVLRKVLPDARGSDEEVKRLWERWIELEEIVGDAASVDSVLKMWKEHGVGRAKGSVMQDVLRMSRFHGVEGLAENDLVVIGVGKDVAGVVDGLGGNSSAVSGGGAGGVGAGVGGGGIGGLGGGSGVLGMGNMNHIGANLGLGGIGVGGNSGGSGGGTGGGSGSGGGGGKRDPRTGRRVDKSGNNNNNNNSNNNHINNGVMNGFMGGPNRRKGGGLDHHMGEENVMKLAVTFLEKLASTMPPIMDPIPNDQISAILRMVVHTPDLFTDTPAGRANATPPQVSGKKRKNDELQQQQQQQHMGNMGGMHMGPPHMQQDVFRARQVSKQSRLR